MRFGISALMVLWMAGVCAAAGGAHSPSSTQPADVTAALAAGKGVALIEVTGVKEKDDRPVDGNLADIVSFKKVKASGEVPDEIRVTKAYGGRRVGAPPALGGVLYPSPLKAGERYWVIFNATDFQKYPQEVVAWWPEKGAPTEALEKAVAPKDAPKADAAGALNKGTALALIEVTGIREQDQRPADGDLFDVVSYRTVKSTGRVPGEIRIIKGYAYPQMAGAPARGPVPNGILFPNPLKAGQRYWVVFSRADSSRYQEGIVAWWPEKDAPAELDAAITAKKFGN